MCGVELPAIMPNPHHHVVCHHSMLPVSSGRMCARGGRTVNYACMVIWDWNDARLEHTKFNSRDQLVAPSLCVGVALITQFRL